MIVFSRTRVRIGKSSFCSPHFALLIVLQIRKHSCWKHPLALAVLLGLWISRRAGKFRSGKSEPESSKTGNHWPAILRRRVNGDVNELLEATTKDRRLDTAWISLVQSLFDSKFDQKEQGFETNTFTILATAPILLFFYFFLFYYFFIILLFFVTIATTRLESPVTERIWTISETQPTFFFFFCQ